MGRLGRRRSSVIDQALAAYAHFLSIFALLALLVAEAAVYRQHLVPRTLDLLRRLDLLYLLAAIAVLLTGLLRVFFFAKGAAFYAANPVFWAKMALVLAVGLISVPPTIHYIRSAKRMSGGELVIEDRLYRRIRWCLTAQLVLFALIPLAATLMARGIGL
jgi:putative membrane protein